MAMVPTRRRCLQFVANVVALVLVLGSAVAAETPRLYGICAAYPPEIAALHREFGVNENRGYARTEINGLAFWRGRYNGRDIVVFRTGVSLVNAAYQLQLALDRFPITHVLFAGVAGGVDPALKIGDVVIPEQWAYHSEALYLNEDGRGDYLRPEHLKSAADNFGMIFPNPARPPLCIAGTFSTARRAATSKSGSAANSGIFRNSFSPALIAPTIRVGNVCQRRRFHVEAAGFPHAKNPIPIRRIIHEHWTRHADAANVQLNRKPILIVRALSDLAGAQPGANPINANETQVSDIAARVLRAIVDEL